MQKITLTGRHTHPQNDDGGAVWTRLGIFFGCKRECVKLKLVFLLILCFFASESEWVVSGIFNGAGMFFQKNAA